MFSCIEMKEREIGLCPVFLLSVVVLVSYFLGFNSRPQPLLLHGGCKSYYSYFTLQFTPQSVKNVFVLQSRINLKHRY